ncbi:hypothetical protein Hanom_Chr10g00929221 [Helianthus anomalus]
MTLAVCSNRSISDSRFAHSNSSSLTSPPTRFASSSCSFLPESSVLSCSMVVMIIGSFDMNDDCLSIGRVWFGLVGRGEVAGLGIRGIYSRGFFGGMRFTHPISNINSCFMKFNFSVFYVISLLLF